MNRFDFKYNIFAHEIKKINLNKNKDSLYEGIFLGSFNFISTPHYFPETGLNLKNEDLLGIEYNNKYVPNDLLRPGLLSLNSENQIENITKSIVEILKKYQMDKKIKSHNILTLSLRLKRSIESATLFNKKLISMLGFTNSEIDSIKPFNLSLYNSTETKENEILEKNMNRTLATYFIPKNYDSEIFPIHFLINDKNCPKLINNYRENLNSEIIKNTCKKLASEIPNLDTIIEDTKEFKLEDHIIQTKTFEIKKNFNSNDPLISHATKSFILESFSNFNQIFEYFEFTRKTFKDKVTENNRMEVSLFKSEKRIPKKFNFIKSSINNNGHKIKFLNSIIKNDKKIQEFVNFDLFFIKNFSDEYIKIYSSEVLKFIMNIVYTYLSTSQDELNKNLKNTKMVNLFLKDYHVAGFFKILTQFKKEIDSAENIIETKNLPKIKYGSTLSLNIIKKQKDLDNENFINNFFVQILFDFKVIKTYTIKDLLAIIINYISNDPLFFSNICQ